MRRRACALSHTRLPIFTPLSFVKIVALKTAIPEMGKLTGLGEIHVETLGTGIAGLLGITPKHAALIFIVALLIGIVFFIRCFCDNFLPIAKKIDYMSEKFGIVANWAVLIACLISAGNATSRYLFNIGSNAWLEAQWYLFAVMVLLGAAYTLRVNEHVRVDLIYGNVSDKTRHWIDLLGGVFFLLPMCTILIWFTWPWFVESWTLNESSNNAGGLIRWPVKLVLPLGFGILALQGFAEIVKRACAIKGTHAHEFAYEKPLQ